MLSAKFQLGAKLTLIIQISLGILLGYLLIEHRARLGQWAIVALKFAMCLVAVAVLITASVYSLNSVGSVMPNVSAKLSQIGKILTMIVFVFPLIAVILFGGYGLSVLTKKIVGRWIQIEPELNTILLMSFLCTLIVWPIDLYLLFNTPYGDFYRSIDQWSRRNGYADLFSSLMSFSLTLWPWLVIFIGSRFGVKFFEERKEPPVLSPHRGDSGD